MYLHIVFFLTFISTSSLFAQTTYIQDSAFEQALIDLGIDSDGTVNQSVATADIADVTVLDVSNRYIWSLVGIADFVNLTELYCQDNDLYGLTLTNNKKLKILDCSNQYESWNGFEPFTLDLSQNNELEYLDCSDNPDHEGGLYLGTKPNLKTLICSTSGLTSLDVSQNTNLEYLDCSYNYQITWDGFVIPFSSLTLGQNIKLKTIYCDYNYEISSLNLSGLYSLEYLNCNINSISSLNFDNNPNLRSLACIANNLTNLNVSGAIALENIGCAYNDNLTTIDLSNNINLGHLAAIYCNLQSLDLSNNPNLWALSCRGNQLTSLNVKNGNNSAITDFWVDSTVLQCIQVDDEESANTGEPPYDSWIKDPISTYSEDCSSLGIVEEILEASISIYPNPVLENLSIEATVPITKIEVYSLLGKKIKEFHTPYTHIPIQNLSNGIYFVKILSDKSYITKKIIKL